jgi:serine/threonine protein kinase
MSPNAELPERFEILRELGRGGMGLVYKALDRSLGRNVVIKTLLSEASPEGVVRAQREAQALAQLDHPNIVRVYDCGVDSAGRPFFVMDFIPGENLAKLVLTEKISKEAACQGLIGIAEAIAHAHDHGFLHRDLKPENIIVRETDQRFILLDFGLSRQRRTEPSQISLTGENTILGTPEYMAPEQADGQRANELTDIYGLGAVLYFILTGQPPYKNEGQGIFSLYKKILTTDPTPPRRLQPDVPEAVEAICLRALQRQPERRFESAFELADALRDLANRHEDHRRRRSLSRLLLLLPLVILPFLWLSRKVRIRLRVDSDPVELLRGEQSLGVIPKDGLVLELPAGKTILTLRRRGASLEFSGSFEPSWFVQDLTLKTRFPLRVQCSAPKAQIHLSELGGEVGDISGDLPLGLYELKVEADSYLSVQRQITLTEPQSLEIKLNPKAVFRGQELGSSYFPVQFCDLNGDGVKDILVSVAEPGGEEDALLYAFSGRGGGRLWVSGVRVLYWTSAFITRDPEPRILMPALNASREPVVVELSKDSGSVLNTVRLGPPPNARKAPMHLLSLDPQGRSEAGFAVVLENWSGAQANQQLVFIDWPMAEAKALSLVERATHYGRGNGQISYGLIPLSPRGTTSRVIIDPCAILERVEFDRSDLTLLVDPNTKERVQSLERATTLVASYKGDGRSLLSRTRRRGGAFVTEVWAVDSEGETLWTTEVEGKELLWTQWVDGNNDAIPDVLLHLDTADPDRATVAFLLNGKDGSEIYQLRPDRRHERIALLRAGGERRLLALATHAPALEIVDIRNSRKIHKMPLPHNETRIDAADLDGDGLDELILRINPKDGIEGQMRVLRLEEFSGFEEH